VSDNQRLVAAFVTSLGILDDLVNDELQYNSISEWDSIGHMLWLN